MSASPPPEKTDDAAELLDWAAFSALNFPGCCRHDLVAAAAYAAYRRDSAPGTSGV